MAEAALASQFLPEPREAVAWAVGCVFSPFSGSAGVSASAWMISYDQWQTPVTPVAKASREANRDQWYAGIKALAGVVADAPPYLAVTIYVVEQQFEFLFKRGWRKTNGKPAAGFEVATQIYADIATKELRVSVVYCSADDNASATQQAAREKAGERYRSLSAKELAAAPSFKRTKPQNRSRRGFPVVRDDEPKY